LCPNGNLFSDNGARNNVLTNILCSVIRVFSRLNRVGDPTGADGFCLGSVITSFWIFWRGLSLCSVYSIIKFIDCNFDFVCYFPLPCGFCSRGYPVRDYYVFVLWLNSFREEDVILKVKKKKTICNTIKLWCYVNMFVLYKENPKKICDMADEKTSSLLREWNFDKYVKMYCIVMYVYYLYNILHSVL